MSKSRIRFNNNFGARLKQQVAGPAIAVLTIAGVLTSGLALAAPVAATPKAPPGMAPPGTMAPGGGTSQSDPPSERALTTSAMKTLAAKKTQGTSTGLTAAQVNSAQIMTLKDGNNTITKGGIYRIQGTTGQGQVLVKAPATAEVVIILEGAKITSATGPALWVQQAKSVTLALSENTTSSLVTLKGAKEAKGAILSEADLWVQGKGTLSVEGQVKHGIAAEDTLTLLSGKITVTGATDAIHVNDYFNQFGGSVTAKAPSDAIESEGSILIAGGITTLSGKDDGLTALGDVLIRGGSVQIKDAVEGIESKQTLTFTGGTTTVKASDDGLNAKTLIDFAGGIQTLTTTKGDAIDSNGKILVRAGTVSALGGSMPEGGIDNDTNAIEVTGGTLLALGGHNSLPTASTSKQLTLGLLGTQAGETLTLVSGGKTLLTYKATAAYASLLYTAPSLALNKIYQVFVNGTLRDTFTADKTLMAIGVSGGMPGPGGMGGTKGNRPPLPPSSP